MENTENTFQSQFCLDCVCSLLTPEAAEFHSSHRLVTIEEAEQLFSKSSQSTKRDTSVSLGVGEREAIEASAKELICYKTDPELEDWIASCKREQEVWKIRELIGRSRRAKVTMEEDRRIIRKLKEPKPERELSEKQEKRRQSAEERAIKSMAKQYGLSEEQIRRKLEKAGGKKT